MQIPDQIDRRGEAGAGRAAERLGRVQQQHFTLRSLPPPQRPRVIADETAALDAFDLEVIASLADPVASKLAAQKDQTDRAGA